jgi:predicted dithiol-disulfide oxidoreductase (DUF899 family)
MADQGSGGITEHAVVPHGEWLAARTAFLAKEKEFTRLRDELNRGRRALPWERVEKTYLFEGPDGLRTLAELFGGRSQLVVYHFMYTPESSGPCSHCSFWADHFDGMLPHLHQRDVSLVAASRAPLARLEAFKQRMGWHFPWVSSGGSDFNYDFQASFRAEDAKSGSAWYNYGTTRAGGVDREGLSVFHKNAAGAVYHTYSCYARGIDMLNGTYHFLDVVPKGRDEDGLKSPQAWVRYHDQYGAEGGRAP